MFRFQALTLAKPPMCAIAQIKPVGSYIRYKPPYPSAFRRVTKPLNGFASVCDLADTILMWKEHLNLIGP